MHAKSEIKEMRKKFQPAEKLSVENHTREIQNQNTQRADKAIGLALLKKRFSRSAMPTDVRKRSALPLSLMNSGLRPNNWAKPKIQMAHLPEGQRPSAHQTA